MIPGLRNKNFEFYFADGNVSLISDGTTVPWEKIPENVINMVRIAYLLPQSNVLRRDIQSRVKEESE